MSNRSHPSAGFSHFIEGGLVWRITMRYHNAKNVPEVVGKATVTSGFFERAHKAADVRFCNGPHDAHLQTRTDAVIDAWHDGYFGERKPEGGVLLVEWEAGKYQAASDLKHRCITSYARPEGYYHVAPDGASL